MIHQNYTEQWSNRREKEQESYRLKDRREDGDGRAWRQWKKLTAHFLEEADTKRTQVTIAAFESKEREFNWDLRERENRVRAAGKMNNGETMNSESLNLNSNRAYF